MAKTCCFTGHRDAPEWIRPALARTIERHIVEYGVTDFLVGLYGGFDCMARAEIIKAKARHFDVRLYLMVAFLPQSKQELELDGCDGTIFPEGMELVPPKAAILRLNCLTINDSNYLIAYVAHSWGGAARTLEYARKRERQGLLFITNLTET